MIAIRGITWSLWQRNRIILPVILGFVLTFSVILAAIGPNQMLGVMRNGFAQLALVLAVTICGFSYLALIGVFIHPDADVGAGGSTYPVHMFTLPVRTSLLVLWPMLLGTGLVFILGNLLALGARHSGVATIPQFWPALFASALLASLQAIFWYPLGIPYSKLVLTFLTIPALSIGAGYAVSYQVPEWEICAGLLSVIAVSGLVALSGVNRARRGDVRILGLSRPSESTAVAKMPETQPFRSIGQAQSWYEWRLHGVVLPVIAAFLFAVFCIPMVWNDTYSPLSILGAYKDGMVVTAPTYIFSYFPVLLVLLPLSAWIIGCGAKRSDVKRSDRTFHLFFATRPVSDGALVAQKLWTAAKSAAVAWVVVLLGFATLLTQMKGSYQNFAGDFVSQVKLPILVILAPYFTPVVVLKIGAVAILLMAVTWRNYAIGFWTELSGKLWLRYAYPLACITAIAFIPPLLAISSQSAVHWITVPAVIIVAWGAVLTKLALAMFLVIDQHLAGSLSLRTIGRSAALYLVGCGAIAGIAFWLTVEVRQALVDQAIASPVMTDGAIIAFVLLWTPLVRIIAAPIMLSMNRHRMG